MGERKRSTMRFISNWIFFTHFPFHDASELSFDDKRVVHVTLNVTISIFKMAIFLKNNY